MTIKEMIDNNPARSTHPPESYFTAIHPTEGETKFCLADFMFGTMVKFLPTGWEDWQVVKEYSDLPVSSPAPTHRESGFRNSKP